MKKIGFLLLLLTSCTNLVSIENYPGAIILNKHQSRSEYYIDIRYFWRPGMPVEYQHEKFPQYYIKTIQVHQYEYHQYNIGDTIKKWK